MKSMVRLRKLQKVYLRPAVVCRGNLTKFAGSPLGTQILNPLELPKR